MAVAADCGCGGSLLSAAPVRRERGAPPVDVCRLVRRLAAAPGGLSDLCPMSAGDVGCGEMPC
jgi:hypothetical protein